MTFHLFYLMLNTRTEKIENCKVVNEVLGVVEDNNFVNVLLVDFIYNWRIFRF